MLIQLDGATRSEEGVLELRLRCGGGIDSPGKIVATLLTAVEEITGVACDDYAAQVARARRRDEETS